MHLKIGNQSFLITQQTTRIDKFIKKSTEFSLEKGNNKLKFKLHTRIPKDIALEGNFFMLVELHDKLKSSSHQDKLKRYKNYCMLMIEHYLYRSMGISKFDENYVNSHTKFNDVELEFLFNRMFDSDYLWLLALYNILDIDELKNLFWTKKGIKSGNRLLHIIDLQSAKKILLSANDGTMLLRTSKDIGQIIVCFKKNGRFKHIELKEYQVSKLKKIVSELEACGKEIKFVIARSNNPENIFIEKNDVLNF